MIENLDIPPPIKKEEYLEELKKIADAEAWITRNTMIQNENYEPELAISETHKDLEIVEPDNKAFNGIVTLILIGFIGLIMYTSENNLILMCSGIIMMIIPTMITIIFHAIIITIVSSLLARSRIIVVLIFAPSSYYCFTILVIL